MLQMRVDVSEGLVQMSAHAIDPNMSYIYGITLPETSIVDEHPSLTSQQEEYDSWEIHDIDLTGLPAKANHKDDSLMAPVGKIIAYEPLKREARVLIGLDPQTFQGALAETAATSGFYGSLSLAHRYKTSAVIAAASGDTVTMPPVIDKTTRKTALEVSLCRVPARPGAKVLEVCPSKAALMRQPHEYLRRFAERYGYPPPPDVPADDTSRGMVTHQLALNTPVLGAYVNDQLAPLVRERLRGIVDSAKFVRRCTISPNDATQRVTIDAGTVRMSSGTTTNNAGMPASSSSSSSSGAPSMAASSSQAPPTSHSSDSMQLDAPSSSTQDSKGKGNNNPLPTSLSKQSATPPSSNEEEKRGQASGASTESKVNDKAMDSDDPKSVMLKLHTENLAMEKRLEQYEKKEREEKKAREEESERKKKQELESTDISTQTAIAQLAEDLKMSEDHKKRALNAYAGMREVMDKAGTPPEKRLEIMSDWMAGSVAAAKKKKTTDEDEERHALHEQARAIAAHHKAKSSSAVMHGGYNDAYRGSSGASEARTSAPTYSVSSSSSSNSMALDDPVMQNARKQAKLFNVSDAEFDIQAERRAFELRMVEKSKQHGASKHEGIVEASGGASTTGRRGGGEELDLNDPEAPRKVYMSLITVTPEGKLELPSYDEVAYGGTTIEKVVKRSLTGEDIVQDVARPRLKKPWRVGLQTLFPEVFQKMVAPMQSIDSQLPERDLIKMHTLGSRNALQYIPEVVSRLRKGNYSNNFYYLDPRRRGTESMADMDIRQAPLMNDVR